MTQINKSRLLDLQSQSGIQLPILFEQKSKPSKSFIQMKKKVRGKNRKGFDLVGEAVSLFTTSLDRDEIKSPEAKTAIQAFLAYVQGNNLN